jgi:hypothetical protein
LRVGHRSKCQGIALSCNLCSIFARRHEVIECD